MSTHFAHAYEKGIDSLPRKTSIVASLVRDRYVADAVVILEHTPQKLNNLVICKYDLSLFVIFFQHLISMF